MVVRSSLLLLLLLLPAMFDFDAEARVIGVGNINIAFVEYSNYRNKCHKLKLLL